MAALLGQFKTSPSIIVKHVDLMFIQHSIGRISPKERRELMPVVLKGISKESNRQNAAALFNLVFRILPDLKLPSRGSAEDEAFRDAIGLEDPEDAKLVAEWFGKLMLLALARARDGPSDGLAVEDVGFLTLDDPDTWRDPPGLNLPETRIRAANLLATGAFTDAERFLPSLYAATSPDNRLSSVGEDMQKRITVSLEDRDLVKRLFWAHTVLQPLPRARILATLGKSAVSTTFTDEVLALVAQDLGSIRTSGSTPPRVTGLEAVKLTRALFGYLNWVARIGPTKGSFQIGNTLMSHLRDYITDQGWPVPEKLTDDAIALRSRAYETIGMLAKGTPMSTSDRLSLVGWLFRSLSEDPTPAVVVNIDGALSSLTSLFAPPQDPSAVDELKRLFLAYMNASEDEPPVVRSSRHAATKWANNCLPFSSPMARWIDILAVAGRQDERSDVVEEGQKGLDPWTYYSNGTTGGTDSPPLDLPDWQEMTGFFFKEPVGSTGGYEQLPAAVREQSMDVDGQSVFVNFPSHRMRAFPLAVNYCKLMLFLSALQEDFKIEPGWERQIEALVRSDKRTRDILRTYLKAAKESSLFDLLTAAFEGMIRDQPYIAEPCATCFVEVASLCPRAVVARLAGRALELVPLVKSNKREIRSLGAKAIGILGAHPSNSPSSIRQLKSVLLDTTRSWRTAIGSELNAAEGAFLGLGHLMSRLVYYSPQTATGYTDGLSGLIPLAKELASAPVSVQAVVFDAATQLWTSGLQCFPDDSSDREVLSYIDVLSEQAKKSNERAIAALGSLTIAFDSSNYTDLVLEKLYELHEIKQAEVHFAVGEAITAVVARWDSDAVQLALDVEPDDEELSSFRVGKRSDLLDGVLAKLLTDCKTTKPSLLKASGIWLFCLIQHCSHLPEIQSRLRECQVAFMRLLSARDELVQETASRGLALVYEKGDPSLKGDLVRDLVSSFTGSGPQLKVDEDTELFDAGALPTGEGKSITSYKDIMNLANEVGDQSLVYKFMSLATNAATWSTRSAFGRFGLSNILSESQVDPKLYPKLYRYRFDPNPNVQKSMNDIWKALVKNPGAVTEKHFDAIIQDLLTSILAKEWRTREASCAAIADLVQGKPFALYEKYYQDIWTRALKVLDDIKTSVRNAALNLCINLSNTLVRQLEESGSTASATAMMNEALPFLMSDKGIESSVDDVKVFATITVMKIAKTGGKGLRPYIAAMVPHLLGLLSTIENQGFNYAYVRSGEDDRQKIDRLRSSMVNRSPISEAIEDCLRNVDSTVMADLATGLESTIKSAIGMPTKIGCGRTLATLATRHAADFAPYSAKFLQILEKQALDKNDEVSQGYARAAAYIMRVAPSQIKEHFAQHCIDLYFSSEEESRRQKVADAVLALSKISPDHFNALESQLLPFAYLGSHDGDDYVRKELDEVWNKHAGSNLSVRRYVPEIVALVQRSLDAHQWAIKNAGALTVATAVKALTGASSLSGQVNVSQLRAIWPVYERSLALKTFPDKEKLLDAFPDFVAKCQEAAAAPGEAGAKGDGGAAVVATTQRLREIALREARRNNDTYRVEAFRCLWRFAAASTDNIELLDSFAKIVSPFMDKFEKDQEGDRMDIDDDSSSKKRDDKDSKEDLARKTAASALEALARGYSRFQMKKEPGSVVDKVMRLLEPYLSSRHFDGIRREVWYKAVADLMDGAAAAATAAAQSGGVLPATSNPKLLLEYFSSLNVDKPDVGTEEQRMTRAKALAAISRAVGKHVFGPTDDDLKNALKQMRDVVEAAVAVERSRDVQKLLNESLGPEAPE